MEIKRHRHNAVKISAIVLLTFFVFSESWAQAIQTYRAKRHDTIESVAEKFGVTVEELLECNKSYRTKKLRARDVLVLPPKKSAREQRQKAREEAAQSPKKRRSGKRSRSLSGSHSMWLLRRKPFTESRTSGG